MPPRPQRDPRRPTPALARLAGNLLGAAFLALAGAFLLMGSRPELPSAPTPPFDHDAIRPVPTRTTLGDPPVVRIGGYDQRCNDCHSLFSVNPNRASSRPRTQHAQITLEHGINDRCANCHDYENLERLRLRNADSVIFPEVALLCAQCHGPVYRDWNRGVHGKTVGAWNPEMGVQVRYTCTNCHNPHAPAYPALKPLPPPNTLRMGSSQESAHEEISHERNVLLRWTKKSPPSRERQPGSARRSDGGRP